jgi:RNA polymerase sigma factor (sigma-70 family)
MTRAEDTIFIIDDDEAMRDSLALLAEAEGFPSRTFASAVDFLSALNPAAEGCVLADVRMPEMSGLELLQQLRAKGVPIPIILITGHGDVPMAVAALKSGAADFFEKPFDDAQLIASLRLALDRDASRRRSEQSIAELRERKSHLTQREREVMDLVVEGLPNKAVADRLGISPRTVEVYRAKVMDKMRARNLSDLVRMALRLSPPPPPPT